MPTRKPVKKRQTKKYTRVSDLERKYILGMRREGISWALIRKISGRGNGAIEACIKKGMPRVRGQVAAQAGAPKKIKPKELKRLVKSLDDLLKASKGRREVTMKMVKTRARVHVCDKTVRQYFKKIGIVFRRLKEKIMLSQKDKKARSVWARKRVKRSKAKWIKSPHAIIDNKKFRIYVDGKGRDHVARRSCRGAYQRNGKRGQALKDYLVKPRATSPYPGAGAIVTAAVINGRIRMWEYVKGKKWTGAKAADMYAGPLAKALKKAYPRMKKWTVLEDNDPTGYKSGKALAAKKKARIVTDDLPPRSPEFNVLDYSLWHAINARMREQERSFSAKKRETKKRYLERLRRTALSLPPSVVKRAVMDMHRRVRLAVSARGGIFIE